MLQTLIRNYEYINRIRLRRLDAGLSFNLDYLTHYIPNDIKHFRVSNHLFDHGYSVLNKSVYNTYSDFKYTMSDYQYWYSVPTNRMLLVRALRFIFDNNITPYDYVYLYKRLDTNVFSESLSSVFDDFNSYDGLSDFVRFNYVYPSFALNLPFHQCDLDLFTEMSYSSQLGSFNLHISDFYDEYGDLKSSLRYSNLRTYHTSDVSFIAYSNKVIDNKVQFSKKRKLNYIIYN